MSEADRNGQLLKLLNDRLEPCGDRACQQLSRFVLSQVSFYLSLKDRVSILQLSYLARSPSVENRRSHIFKYWLDKTVNSTSVEFRRMLFNDIFDCGGLDQLIEILLELLEILVDAAAVCESFCNRELGI